MQMPQDFIVLKGDKFEDRTEVLNPFMPSGLFYLKSLDRSISYVRGVWLVFCFIITMFFLEISEIITNIVDPDQTPRFAVETSSFYGRV